MTLHYATIHGKQGSGRGYHQVRQVSLHLRRKQLQLWRLSSATAPVFGHKACEQLQQLRVWWGTQRGTISWLHPHG